MASRIISTWFYSHELEELGAYAQMRGDQNSERFKDVYRRCIGLHFASARRSNPDAQLVLYLNSAWNASTSVAEKVLKLLEELDVELRIIPFTYVPPETWGAKWRNQFFVLDILQDIESRLSPEDNFILLDSDVLWTEAILSEKIWAAIRLNGLVAYPMDYPLNQSVNGISRVQMGEIVDDYLNKSENSEAGIPYFGGEFYGIRADVLSMIVREFRGFWEFNLSRSPNERRIWEEAHFLSSIINIKGTPVFSDGNFVKRIWTQFGHFKNVSSLDMNLALWHLPAEKRFGFARLWKDLSSDGYANWRDRQDWKEYVGRRMGIPKNTSSKIARDLFTAISGRIPKF